MNYFRNSGEEFLVNQISLWMLGGCVERKGSVFNTVLVDPVILANVDQVMAFQVIISSKTAYFFHDNRSVLLLINIAFCKKKSFLQDV